MTQSMQLYIKEIGSVVHVLGVVPGKDLYNLGSRKNVQEVICHALGYARLLGVPEEEVYVCSTAIPEQPY